MRNKFNYIVKLIVDATCDSPFRVGDNSNDIENVLKDRYGIPFIPATSIAGAMRAYVGNTHRALETVLFGGQESEGALVITDGIFSTYKEVTRPRVRINQKTGTVDKGAKFDVAHIESGSQFSFTITWSGMQENLDELEVLHDMLASLQNGAIQLGAQKTNGFGKVSIKVKEQRYDMTDSTDRNHWLQNTGNPAPIRLKEMCHESRVIFQIKGKVNNVLVKGDMRREDNSTNIATNMKENHKMIIPGSSIKGAVRQRVLEIAEVLGLGKEIETEIFGGADNAGSIFFQDIILEEPKLMKQTRIHVNKFTGGVIQGGLFAEEPLASKIIFNIKTMNDNRTCKLLLFALRDLAAGCYTVGSGYAIGRGVMDIEEIRVRTHEQKEAKIVISQDKKISMYDSDEVIAHWMKS